MEIPCVFGSQLQNDAINSIATIDTFERPSFVKKVEQRSSANPKLPLLYWPHWVAECDFIWVRLIKRIDDLKRLLPDAAKIRARKIAIWQTRLWWLTFKNFCSVAYVMLIGLKNNYDGVIRGLYLKGVIKVTALRKIVRTPSKIRSLNLTLYWNPVFFFFFFFGHLSDMDRKFLVMTDFFRSQWPKEICNYCSLAIALFFWWY